MVGHFHNSRGSRIWQTSQEIKTVENLRYVHKDAKKSKFKLWSIIFKNEQKCVSEEKNHNTKITNNS